MNKIMDKISVIIPTYKTDTYFDTCLQSVLNQTYANLEIIIINDGNEAEFTNQLIDAASKDERIKLIHHNKRQGVAFARNRGLKEATGKYLYFLDSDDYIASNTLAQLVKYTNQANIIKGKIENTYVSNQVITPHDELYKLKIYKENRFKLINDHSVLNTLFNKDYLDKHQFNFSEEIEVYSDLTFIIPAYLATPEAYYVAEAVYFHRKRNDPINNPSLIQMDDEQRITTYLTLYRELKKLYNEKIVQKYLDQQLLNFYQTEIISYINNDPKALENIFEDLAMTFKQMDSQMLSKYKKPFIREIKAIQADQLNRYKKIMNQHTFLRRFKRIATSRSLLKRAIYKRVFFKLPLKKNLVFLESFLGKSYSDSPKAIYEYLIEHNYDYEYVWSFNETGKNIPGNAKQVKRFSLKYFYYVARAKYWVSNSRMPKYLGKRKGNVYLQTWHGTPLKRLVFDMDEVHSADPNYKANFYAQSRRWDYLSSPNKYSSTIFRRAFEFNKDMLEFGYPKNDLLYNKNNETTIQAIKKKLHLPEDKKVILYAPTWRDDDYFSRGKYRFELELNLKEMQKRLGDDYVVVLRMHYFIANQLNIEAFSGFAYDYSTYDDIAELYLISDILITDYSSVFFDYANLKRPILFFTYDIEKYRDELRGFYLDMEKDLPGPLLMTSNDVINAVENITDVSRDFEEKYEAFYQRFCEWEDGRASERTVKTIFND